MNPDQSEIIFDDLLSHYENNNFLLPSALTQYGPALSPYLKNKVNKGSRFSLTHKNGLFPYSLILSTFCRDSVEKINAKNCSDKALVSSLSTKLVNKIKKDYLSNGNNCLLIHFKVAIEVMNQILNSVGSEIRRNQEIDKKAVLDKKDISQVKLIDDISQAKINILHWALLKIEKKYVRTLYEEASQQSEMYKTFVSYLWASTSFNINKDAIINYNERYYHANSNSESKKVFSIQDLSSCLIDPIVCAVAFSDEITTVYPKPYIRLAYKEHIEALSKALEESNLLEIKKSFTNKYFVEKGTKGPNIFNIENVLMPAQFHLFEKISHSPANSPRPKINPLSLFLMFAGEENKSVEKSIEVIKNILPFTYQSMDYKAGLSSAIALKDLLSVNYPKDYKDIVAFLEQHTQKEELEILLAPVTPAAAKLKI